MSSYSFSDEAVRDLDEICEYIARNNPQAASRLFDRIRQKCKVLAGLGRALQSLCFTYSTWGTE